jgi:serine/threonine protein kinase
VGEGRFGPVHVGIDPESSQIVVIRTFTLPLTGDQQQALVDALRRLCDTPLDHASIGRPLDCGVQDGIPYLVHTYLPGQSVDEYLAAYGPRPLSEVAIRVTHLAAAIDFAAAVGVYHGALGPQDIIFAPESSGVSGFGLLQALGAAGVDAHAPSAADDIYGLAAMTFELLVGRRYTGGGVREGLLEVPGLDPVVLDLVSRALEDALSPDPSKWPAGALQFAKSLHEADALWAPTVAVQRPAPTPIFETGRLELGEEFPAESERHVPEPPVPHDLPPPQAREARPPGRPMFDAPLFESARVADEPSRFEERHPEPEPELRFRHVAAPVHQPVTPMVHREESSGWRVAAVAALVAMVVTGGLGAAYYFGSRAGDSTASVAPALPPQGEQIAQSTPPPPVAEPEIRNDGAEPLPPQPAPPPVAEPAAPVPPPAATPPQPLSPATPRSEPAPRAGDSQPAVVDPLTLSGRVLIRSNPPGAQVLVDGQSRGDTPVAIRGLEFGEHTIAVTAAGHVRWEQKVTLTADRPSQSFEIVLATTAGRSSETVAAAGNVPATLQIDSRPSGAQVWMNGTLVGTTPLVLPTVDVGSHAVRIELPGYRPWTTSIQVTRGERARVAASLEK